MAWNDRDAPEICLKILEELDRRYDRDPDELPPLGAFADCDALSQLVDSVSTGHFTFRYDEYEITVHMEDETVTIERAGNAAH